MTSASRCGWSFGSVGGLRWAVFEARSASCTSTSGWPSVEVRVARSAEPRNQSVRGPAMAGPGTRGRDQRALDIGLTGAPRGSAPPDRARSAALGRMWLERLLSQPTSLDCGECADMAQDPEKWRPPRHTRGSAARTRPPTSSVPTLVAGHWLSASGAKGPRSKPTCWQSFPPRHPHPTIHGPAVGWFRGSLRSHLNQRVQAATSTSRCGLGSRVAPLAPQPAGGSFCLNQHARVRRSASLGVPGGEQLSLLGRGEPGGRMVRVTTEPGERVACGVGDRPGREAGVERRP